ncbi:hypothetical protein [Longitalea arenae]|uniref:hypothetical protein n=1 Tax=Longitalea arenae TaxID=2812558 RepID=UPI0019680AB8|nr:hypothetical protein [Longitalea arenae]
MKLFFLHAAKDPRSHPDKHPHVHPHGPIHDLSEGSEFLDDAIHMEDVQEIKKEQNAPESNKQSPEN